MAPDAKVNQTFINKDDDSADLKDTKPFKAQVQWHNVAVNLFIHLGFFVGFYYIITGKMHWKTYIYCK
jgi:hypothetical protein